MAIWALPDISISETDVHPASPAYAPIFCARNGNERTHVSPARRRRRYSSDLSPPVKFGSYNSSADTRSRRGLTQPAIVHSVRGCQTYGAIFCSHSTTHQRALFHGINAGPGGISLTRLSPCIQYTRPAIRFSLEQMLADLREPNIAIH
jgi:hypothetical protein